MLKYPIFLDLAGKRVVVIGAGGVGARKVQSLAETGARVVVVSPAVDPVFEQVCSEYANVELILAPYAPEYLTGALLAVAATNDLELNARIYADCQQKDVLCNMVDRPEQCDFYVPAVVRRGPLQIAISTDGHCPAYAGHVRRKLEEMFTEAHGRFVEELEAVRKRIILEVPDANERKALLGELVGEESMDLFIREGTQAWRRRADERIRRAAARE